MTNRDLAGKTVEYTYDNGVSIVLEIGAERLGFEWSGGELDGTKIGGIPYKCQMMRAGQYMVNWHNTDAKSFATIVIDLEERKVHGSALIFYGAQEEQELFEEAVITGVTEKE